MKQNKKFNDLYLRIFICSLLILIWITAFLYTICLNETGEMLRDYKYYLSPNSEIDKLKVNNKMFNFIQSDMFSSSNIFLAFPPE